jgi:hypothetical protein
MLKIEDIKKLLETSGLDYKEVDNGIIIFKESSFEFLDNMKEILKAFGVKNEDISIVDDGTIVKTKDFSAQKLKIVLSPYYPLEKMEVIDSYTLKIKDLMIDKITESEEVEPNGSADDLGDTPEEGEGIVGIDDLTQIIDSKFPDVEIVIVSDNKMELPTIDEIIDFLKSIEDQLENFDIEITDNKIIVKGK